MSNHGYTIVQHSAFGRNGDPQFARAVESRAIPNKPGLDTVVKVGGLVFPSYGDAEDFCEKANYPAGYGGLIPDCRGKFSSATVDGDRIYIPVREVVG